MVAVEYAGVNQFVLEVFTRSVPVGHDQLAIRKLSLRVFVQIFHVGVSGSAVDVEVILLDILAMVPLAVGEPKQALLQDRIPLVPERESETEPLLLVADSS